MGLFNSFLIAPAVIMVLMLLIDRRMKKAFPLLGVLASLLTLSFGVYYFSMISAQQSTILEKIEPFGFMFAFNADSAAVIMLLLTSILFFGVFALAPRLLDLKDKEKEFNVLSLLMQIGLMGTFLAYDLISFYIAWEVVLVPAFLLVGIWGGPNRIKATVKFFLYTLTGSLFMLVGFIIIIVYAQNVYAETGQKYFLFSDLYKLKLDYADYTSTQSLVGLFLLFAFFIKVPLAPFHGWLRDTYVEAPTIITVVIAGVMGKMGLYGLIRFMPMFPDFAKDVSTVVLLVSAIGVIYGIFCATRSVDFKELVAYISLSHVSALVFGFFTLNQIGISGAIMQMFNHGLLIAGLFVVVGYLERKDLLQATGLSKATPVLAVCFFILTLGAIALPMTNGFVGEVMIYFGGFKANETATYIALLGTIFGAVVMLRVFSKYMFESAAPKPSTAVDIQGSLKLYLVALSIIVVVTGVYPHSLFQGTEEFVNQTMSILFLR